MKLAESSLSLLFVQISLVEGHELNQEYLLSMIKNTRF